MKPSVRNTRNAVFFVCLLLSFGLDRALGQLQHPLAFRNGSLKAEKGLGNTRQVFDTLRLTQYGKKYYSLIQFDRIPGQAEKQALALQGVRLYDYIPGRAFYAELPEDISIDALRNNSVTGVYHLPSSLKIAPSLLRAVTPIPAGSDALIGVSWFGSQTEAETRQALQNAGATIVTTKIRPPHTIFVRAGKSSLAKIAELPFVNYIGLQSLTDRALNFNDRAAHGADAIGGVSGRNLRGDSIYVGVGDNGDPYTHIDFTGRLIERFSQIGSTHGVHTSGTTAGGGLLDPRYAGMAPHAHLISQYFSDILVNAGTYITDYDMVLTNNSYTAYSNGCDFDGEYDFISNYMDAMALQYPNLLNVFAAGNDGMYTCSPFAAPYGTIKSGYQTSKNLLSIGNIDNSNYTLYNGSSCGPVYDGRIKPDIVAGGANIYSTFPNNSYGSSSGTSMACPAVTGTLALVIQRYRQLNGGSDPSAALVKALACNTATDLGNPGPDYLYGFGSLNAKAAVEAMESNAWFAGAMSTGGSDTYTIHNIPAGVQQLKVLLYWPDPPATAYSNTALVNDLDITVTASDGTLHHPLILNPSPAHAADAAVEGLDKTNNIEQVVIDHPPAGNCTINVKGASIPSGPQSYVVVYQTTNPSVSLLFPYGDETLVPGEQQTIRWTAAGGEPNTFSLDYSADNGASWTSIYNAIPAAARSYTWTVPATATAQGRIRITRNSVGYADSSHAPFVILGQPTLSLTNPCQGYASLIWTKTASATAYDILLLKGDSMQKIASTTDTSFLAGNLSRDSSYWFTVRAVNGSTAGRRAVAANIVPSGGACNLSALDNDYTVDSLVLPASSGRLNTSTALSNATQIRVEYRNLGTVAGSAPPVLHYRINGGTSVDENAPADLAAGAKTVYTFAQTADLAAAGLYQIQTWITYSGDPHPENDTLTTTLNQLANDPLVLNPSFTEDFESASPAAYTSAIMGLQGLDRFDFRANNSNGRASTFINTGFARSGNRCATLDQQHYGVVTTADSLIGTFNLGAYSNTDQIWLNFYYRNQGIDSTFAGNKVWIRGSDQSAWVPVLTLDNSVGNIGVYQAAPNIDIRGLLAAATPAQSVTSSFQIKFGEEGHATASSVTPDGDIEDGYSFDDIVLTRAASDAAVIDLESPSLGSICGLGNAEKISLKVRNYSASTLTAVPVSYSVNGVTVTETIPTLAPFDSLVYVFSHTADLSAYQAYTIRAWVSSPGDTYHFNDSLAPVSFQTTPLIASFPYLEGFETNNGYWYTGGVNSSWQWGAPAKPIIRSAAGGSKCWVTSLTGHYNDNELSYLYSPCFDLSSLAHPMLSFSHIFQTEDNCTCDFHWMEYSTDDINWYRLGSVGLGTNWYDNLALLAWQNSDTAWHVSSFDLPTSTPRIRLRFVMNSDPGTNYEGVAIDDIHIFDKTSIYNGASIGGGLTRSVSGSGWVNFDTAGQRIVSINPNGQDLGSTSTQVFINTGAVRNDSVQYYLDRNLVIRPANAPTSNVSVRYYFLDSEVRKMRQATGCAGCTTLPDAYEAGITQYSSSVTAEEDSTLYNDRQGIFRFLLPRQDVHVIPYDNGYYAEYQVTGFSEFWINNGGPSQNLALPANLLSFTVVKSGTSALLQWSVSGLDDATRFVIERSKDGQSFSALDSVAAVSGGQLHNYSYTDVHPGAGTTWYRLRMVDADGSYSLSPIRSIDLAADGLSIICYPNPIHNGNLYISTSSPCKRIRLTDAAGKLVLVSGATGYLNAIPVARLAKGLYFVTVDTDGESKVQKVFVK